MLAMACSLEETLSRAAMLENYVFIFPPNGVLELVSPQPIELEPEISGFGEYLNTKQG